MFQNVTIPVPQLVKLQECILLINNLIFSQQHSRVIVVPQPNNNFILSQNPITILYVHFIVDVGIAYSSASTMKFHITGVNLFQIHSRHLDLVHTVLKEFTLKEKGMLQYTQWDHEQDIENVSNNVTFVCSKTQLVIVLLPR